MEPAHTEYIDSALQGMDSDNTEDISVFILEGGSVQLSFNPPGSDATEDAIRDKRHDIETQLSAVGLAWQVAQ